MTYLIRNCAILLFLVFTLSCKKNAQSTEQNTSTQNSPNAIQSSVDKLGSQKWTLARTILLNNYDVTGLSSFKHLIFLTDSINNVFIQMDTLGENGLLKKVDHPLFVRSSISRLLIPSSSQNKILVYRGKEFYDLNVFEELNGPTSAYARTISNYVVADGKNHRLLLATESGEEKIIGSKGSEFGQFIYPTNVEMRNNEIYVLDSGNKRVQVFDMEGNFKRAFGSEHGMVHPTGMAFSDTEIFISDIVSSTIYVFSLNGELKELIEEYINGPTAINYDNGNLLVANKYSKNLVILREN